MALVFGIDEVELFKNFVEGIENLLASGKDKKYAKGIRLLRRFDLKTRFLIIRRLNAKRLPAKFFRSMTYQGR